MSRRWRRGRAAALALALAVAAAGAATVWQAARRVARAAGPTWKPGTAAAAPPPPAAAGPVLSLAPFSTVESETDVAAAPDGRVAVAWISFRGRPGGSAGRIAYAVSADGGASFGAPALADPRPGWEGYDPALAAAPDGTFHLAWIGVGPSGRDDDEGIFAARLPAGAAVLDPPVRVTAAGTSGTDKPTIAIARRGTVVVTYDLDDPDGLAEAARSTDAGTSWHRADVPSSVARDRWLFAVCASRGSDRIHVTFGTRGAIGLQHSDDEGATWSHEEARVSLAAESGDVEAWQSSTCVASGRDVWVVYGLSRDGWGEDGDWFPRSHGLRLARSRDGGRRFADHRDVHEASDPPGTLYLLPKIARDAAGALHLVYYRAEPAGAGSGASSLPPASFRHRRSTDGGATFGPSTSLRSGLRFDHSRRRLTWLGDYVGLTTGPGGAAWASFVDNAAGWAHVACVPLP